MGSSRKYSWLYLFLSLLSLVLITEGQGELRRDKISPCISCVYWFLCTVHHLWKFTEPFSLEILYNHELQTWKIMSVYFSFFSNTHGNLNKWFSFFKIISACMLCVKEANLHTSEACQKKVQKCNLEVYATYYHKLTNNKKEEEY